MPWCASPDVTGRRQRNRLPYNSSYISTDYIPDHPTASKVLCRVSGGEIFTVTTMQMSHCQIPGNIITQQDTGKPSHWKSTLKDYKIRIYLFRKQWFPKMPRKVSNPVAVRKARGFPGADQISVLHLLSSLSVEADFLCRGGQFILSAALLHCGGCAW